MADSNELNTFDNKAYVKGDEAADGNGNQVKAKNSSNYGGDKESLKENRFTNLNSAEIHVVKKGKVYIYWDSKVHSFLKQCCARSSFYQKRLYLYSTQESVPA